jgi:hypothetical protein
MVEEATHLFPKNVTVKNSHKLAFAAVGWKYKHKLAEKIPLAIVMTLLDECRARTFAQSPPPVSRVALASYTTRALDTFLASAADAFSADEHIDARALPWSSVILAAVLELWGRMCDATDAGVPMTHGGHLKLYHLSRPSLVDKFDCILLDEAQDASAVVLDLVLKQACPLIIVGDPHQQIYSFAGTRSAVVALYCSLMSLPFFYSRFLHYPSSCIASSSLVFNCTLPTFALLAPRHT